MLARTIMIAPVAVALLAPPEDPRHLSGALASAAHTPPGAPSQIASQSMTGKLPTPVWHGLPGVSPASLRVDHAASLERLILSGLRSPGYACHTRPRCWRFTKDL